MSFSAPASNGGSAITSYIVTCLAAGQVTKSASGAGSPLNVYDLTAGIEYACSAVATNGAGSGASSIATPVTALAGVNIVPSLLLLLLD